MAPCAPTPQHFSSGKNDKARAAETALNLPSLLGASSGTGLALLVHAVDLECASGLSGSPPPPHGYRSGRDNVRMRREGPRLRIAWDDGRSLSTFRIDARDLRNWNHFDVDMGAAPPQCQSFKV